MNLKRICVFLLTCAFLLALAACGAAEDQSESVSEPVSEAGSESGSEQDAEITITDLIGRDVQIVPGSYQRVVCIGAGALRMYSYIVDVSLLAGVEDIDNPSLADRPKMFDAAARPYVIAFRETFEKLPSCGVGGPNAQAAEAEKILSCNPDIVISEYEDVEKENALQKQLGVPVITLKAGPDGVFAEAFRESMKLLGKVFACEERAETLVSFVEQETQELKKRTAKIAEADKPAVYICGLGNWGTTNHLMTSEKYATFDVAGIKNVVSGLGIKGIGPIEEEKFVSLGADMDMIFIDAAAMKNIKPLYADDPAMFDTCKAWQNGEVYLEMAYNAYYTNYEIALANAWFLAMSVYPDLFADVDMTAKLNEITRAFLGMDLADEIYACGNSFGGYQKIDVSTFFG